MAGLAAVSTGKVQKKKDMVAEIVGILMMSRTYSHMAHLKTPSYSKHMALNDFYDDESDADFDITEMADDLAEAAQGLWGKLDIPFVQLTGNVDDPITSFEAHLTKIKRLAKGCEEPYLDNILQEIEKLYRQTIYKMRELN